MFENPIFVALIVALIVIGIVVFIRSSKLKRATGSGSGGGGRNTYIK